MTKPSLLKKAWQLLSKYELWWETWENVREHALNRDLAAAKKALVDDYEFTKRDAAVLVDWLGDAIQGSQIELVEIAVSDIVYPVAELQSDCEDDDYEDEDETDPFELPSYLARRGAFIDKLLVGERTEGSEVIRKVWFKSKELDLEQIDQVWEVRKLTGSAG